MSTNSYTGELAISKELAANLRNALSLADRKAHYNVTHDNDERLILDAAGNPIPGRYPAGGPFGAILAIGHEDGRLEIVGEPSANNVIGSGIASNHAESMSLRESNYAKLKPLLREYKAQGKSLTVIDVASAQPCTNCHAKLEATSHDLLDEGLTKPGHFIVLYGATYDQTFNMAQFFDAQYADAMIMFSHRPNHPGNLIKHDRVAFDAAPLEVQEKLREAQGATAMVTRNGSIYTYKEDQAIGTDGRTEFSLFATPEVSAVQKACLLKRAEGEKLSWRIDGDLWTTTPEIGPLLIAEMGWTKINAVHTVTMPEKLAAKQFNTLETSMPNAKFQKILAGGYRHPDATVTVLRDRTYVNTAQPMWARVLEANSDVLYNGAEVSEAVLAMRDIYTRFRFAGEDMCNYCVGEKPAPLQPLGKLGNMKPAGVDYTG